MEQDTKLCARCGAAPRNSSLKSYCVDCKRALARESAERRGRWKTPQETCSRCGGLRNGPHLSYCVKCFKAYRLERSGEICARCGKVRAEDDRGNAMYCSDCWRGWWLKRNYGLTVEGYLELLELQGHRCAICASEHNGRSWHIDHDHVTGKVRGLLCDKCNRGLGHFNDNPDRLVRAALYLEASASA